MSSSTSKHMIKGMIALSISPFLVVDDNIHIAPKGMHVLVVMGTSRIMNSPSMCAYKIYKSNTQDVHIEKSPTTKIIDQHFHSICHNIMNLHYMIRPI